MLSKLGNNGLRSSLLLVERSKSILKIMKSYFSEKGLICYGTSDLELANEIINKKKIDYMLLDMDLDNGEIIQLLDAYESNTKIFILGNKDDEKIKNEAYKRGVIDYIVKDNDFLNKITQIRSTILKLEKNKSKNILIIEDSKIIQHQLKDLLGNRNYNILQAYSIEEAKTMINTKSFDLMLLDIELKDGNGQDFLKENKNIIISERKAPVLFVSGNINSNTMRDCLKIGAVDVLKKPYIVEELILKVDLWIDYKRKEEEIENSTKLLEQYKDTVDRSFIVSKADPSGKIIYVNEEFCHISGYTKEQLIGKPHNIIRHPDTPKEVFKQMWQTIKEKKEPWSGEVKNKTKDGSEYWVQSVINPILDTDGNIIEYIGIRSDITQEKKIKDYFENQLNISSKKFGEALNLTKEYEKAIDSSNILSRTDKNGVITYANEHFINISGFSKDELIGSSHNIVNHPDTPKEVFKEMWQSIRDGEVWQGVLKNRNKNGEPYWVDTYIIPIRDENKEIVEFMSIRHDLTDVYNLHTEIEATQREIVYKMGEIGETRSKETGHHVKRVAEYSKLLALEYGLSEKEADVLFSASPMHDIGKVGIPDDILKKPGRLDESEFKVMQTHAQIGYNILKGSSRDVLKAAAIVANEHHERWDGKGYPNSLSGEDIHIFGRITAIADVFDALGSQRCYKPAWEDEKIFKLFKEERGKQFDPKLIDIFFDKFEQIDEIRKKYKDEDIV